MGIKVRATEPGYYGKYREAGEEFVIRKKDDMGSWMEPLETSVPKGKASKGGEGGESPA